MPLRVMSMVQYLTAEVEQMRPGDFKSLQIAKAVKGRDPGGRRSAIVAWGHRYTFGPGQPQEAVALFVRWAALVITAHLQDTGRPAILVPVPNSKATRHDQNDFRTFELARQIAAATQPSIAARDELRWTQIMLPANQGGDRLAYNLYPLLSHRATEADAAADRILIDDIFTTGGHLQACAALLRENGLRVEIALACGRTKHEQLTNPYSVPVEELPDFDPADPFGFGFLEL